MDTKSFTIKGARLSDIEAFNAFKEKEGFTQGKVFEELIAGRFSGKPSVNTDSLQQQITEKTTELQQVNDTLNNKLQEVIQQLKDRDAQFTEKEAEYTAQINQLTTQVNTLTTRLEDQALPETAIVLLPTAAQAGKLRKARPFLKRDGAITADTNYPGDFILTVTERFLKNKYGDIF